METKDLIEAYAAGKRDFHRVNLHGADLRRVNLHGADLRGVNLRMVNLHGADLRRVNLRGADLCGADLRRVNLRGANLYGANLYGADLRGVNLRMVNLHGADLCGADLRRVKIDPRVVAKMQIVPVSGDLHVWKKLKDGVICSLIIPDGVPRLGGAVGRKCRAERALVVTGSGVSMHDGKTEYSPGLVVVADNYDPNPFVECSGGIHFFLTREEAEDYQ